MALVAYDYSDDSDDYESEKIPETKTISQEATVKTGSLTLTKYDEEVGNVPSTPGSFKLPDQRINEDNCSGDVDDDDDDSDDEEPINISFSNLSKPQFDTLYIDESKVKSSKSEIWKKLISLPKVSKTNAMSKERSRNKQNNMESGLLSILPSPAKETGGSAFINTKLLPTTIKNKTNILKKEVRQIENDDDENSDSETDFFSLSKVDKVEDYDTSAVDVDIAIEDPIQNVEVPKKPVVSSIADYFRNDLVRDNDTPCTNAEDLHLDSQNPLDLDEEAVLKLCGRKRKGQSLDDVQVIDIHEDSILAETRKNLTKRLTEEVSYRPARPGGTSSLSKRKHQITYLAFQAKERELELKNQWANNRFTKRQTQSKYGF